MKWTLVLCAILFAQAWAKEKHHECPDRYPSELAKGGAEKTYNELSEGKPLYQFDLFEAEEGFKPLETHTLGLRSNDRSRMFRGFHVSVTSDDAKCTPGKLKAYHKGVKEVKHCNVLVNSKDEPTVKVPITWKAPPCGCVTFRATVIEDKTKYYLDDGRLEDGPLTKTVCALEDVNFDVNNKNEMEGEKEDMGMVPLEKYQPKKEMLTVVKEIAEDFDPEMEPEYDPEEFEPESEEDLEMPESESEEEELDEEEEDIEDIDDGEFDRMCKASEGKMGRRPPKRMRFWSMMGLCCRYEGDERSECVTKARTHVREHKEARQDRRRPDNRPRPAGRPQRPGRKPEEGTNRPRMVRPGSKRGSMFEDRIALSVEAFRDIRKNPFTCLRSASFIAPRQTDSEGISALCQHMEEMQDSRPPMRRPRPGMRGEEERRPHMRRPRPGMEKEGRPGPRPGMRRPGMEEHRNRPHMHGHHGGPRPMHKRPGMAKPERYAEGIKQLAHKVREGMAMTRTQRSAEEAKPALLGHKHEQHRFDKSSDEQKPAPGRPMFGHQHEKHQFDEEYQDVLQDRKEGVSRCCSMEGEEQGDCFRSQQKTDMETLCAREDLTTHGKFGLSHPCCQEEEEGRRAECFDQERYWFDEEVHETDFTPDLEKFYDTLQDLIDLKNPWRTRALVTPERIGRYCEMTKKWQAPAKEDVPSQFGVFYNWYERVQRKMNLVECCQNEDEQKVKNCISEESRQRVDRYCSTDPKFAAQLQPAHPCCQMSINEKYQCFAQEKVDYNEEIHSKDFTPVLSDYMEEYWNWLEQKMEEGFDKDPRMLTKNQTPDIPSEEEELEEELEEIEFSDSEMEDLSELDDEPIEELEEEEEEEESASDALRPLVPRLVRKVDCCKAGKNAANGPRTCRNKALSYIGSLPLRTSRGKNICQRMFWKCCQRVKRTGQTVAPQPPRVPTIEESEEILKKEPYVISEKTEESMDKKNIPVDTTSSEEDMGDFEEMDNNDLEMLENELSDMDIDSVVEEAEDEEEEEEEEEGFSPRAPGRRRGKPGRMFVRRCCRVGKRFGRSSPNSCESRAAQFVRRMRRPQVRRVCSRVLTRCCEKMPRPTKVPESTTASEEPATTTPFPL
ncbi:uncharacterized protein LOC144865597 isoform X1 [Branchiostoma floridae x Branchiostoma japonicum]